MHANICNSKSSSQQTNKKNLLTYHPNTTKTQIPKQIKRIAKPTNHLTYSVFVLLLLLRHVLFEVITFINKKSVSIVVFLRISPFAIHSSSPIKTPSLQKEDEEKGPLNDQQNGQ